MNTLPHDDGPCSNALLSSTCYQRWRIATYKSRSSAPAPCCSVPALFILHVRVIYPRSKIHQNFLRIVTRSVPASHSCLLYVQRLKKISFSVQFANSLHIPCIHQTRVTWTTIILFANDTLLVSAISVIFDRLAATTTNGGSCHSSLVSLIMQKGLHNL